MALVVATAFLLSPEATPARAPDEVASSLVAELDRRIGAIARWEHEVRAATERAAEHPDVLRGLTDSGPAEALDRSLVRACVDLEGCALVDPNGALLASLRARDVPSSLVERALQGRTVRSRLTSTDSFGRRTERVGAPRASVLFAAPVMVDREVVAVLVGRARPDRQLDPLLTTRPPGRTGETYVVDPEGFMITRSRFGARAPRPTPLRKRAAPLVLDRPAVALLTPHLEPTRAFAEARAGHDGVDVEGYLDYRGVPVVGAWRWLDDLGAGVITEMDVVEAYRR